MKRAALLLVSFVLGFGAKPALADWSVGANLGISVFTGDGADFTTFQWPYEGLSPGLRVAWVPDATPHELFFDLGATISDTPNATTRELIATANYQWNFRPEGASTPYVTAGGGILSTAAQVDALAIDASSTGTVFGGGLGWRRRIAGGFGTLRGELRYDLYSEAKDGDVVLFPEVGAVQLKVGFDVWVK